MNKHYEDATGFIDEATDASVWSIEQQPTVASMAVAEATLTLAYEQRTANLIALYNMTESNCEGLSTAGPMSRESWDSAAKQIKERLGL